MRIIRLVLAVAALTAAVGGALVLLACEPPEPANRSVLYLRGDAAPSYEATTLRGDTLALARLRGSVVLLNVWATWCKPCIDELPLLQELHEGYGPERLRVIGVSIDYKPEHKIRSFLDQFGVTYTSLKDTDISKRIPWVGIPRTLLIDRAGYVQRDWLGGLTNRAGEVVTAVEELLAEMPVDRAAGPCTSDSELDWRPLPHSIASPEVPGH